MCSGAVGIPSLQVWFHAESTTSADEVDRILTRIEIVRNQVGVPSYQSQVTRPTGVAYAKALEQLGLKTRFLTRTSQNYRAGEIFAVSPRPGTVLAPGATVTVTVVR
ncbi:MULTISPECIES: PASTA domain-containing protein [unclassified Kribbella]|uniref:PASTA domain-containing protein n=1 Tax=unclassified Kribbella TaxID=2644121 RepID=UPI00340178E6